MKTFKAAVIPAPRAPVSIEEVPAPSLEPNSALLATLYSEVCGTDVHLWHGRLAGVPYPLIPGHVSIGRIEELRGEMLDVAGAPFREGEVVGFLDVHGTCGACHYCLVAKQSTRCPRRKVYGITFGLHDGLHGGWAERIYLRPGTRLLRIPADLSPETYIGGGCGLNTAFHAVERAGVRMGDTVAVLGTGPVGLSAIAFSALAGADTVIAIGAPEDRLAMAVRMGARETISIEKHSFEERRELVRAMTGGLGADVVIEAAGDPRAVPEGAAFCRDGGVLAVAGQYTDNGPVAINVHELINKKHLEVRGVWGSDFSHFYKSIRAMWRNQDRFPWREMITKKYSLEETGAALRAVEAREVIKAAIVPRV